MKKEEKKVRKEKREEEIKERLKSAEKFAKELRKKLGDKVMCVVVWGSVSRGEHTKKSDTDVFVVLDDTKLEEDVPLDIKDRIRFKIMELAQSIDKRITLQYFAFLTEFWDDLRHGEPLVIEVLRWGIPVFDVGIFAPAKRLLQRGKITSTREAIARRLSLATAGLRSVQGRIFSAPHYLEQAMANAGQAPIMLTGRYPPGKEKVGEVLEELFVKTNMLEKEYADIAREISEFNKKSERGEIKVTGQLLDEYINKTERFIKRMYDLVAQIGAKRRFRDIIEDYKNFLRVNIAALKYKGIEPPEKREDLPKVVIENLHLKETHAKLFEKWEHLLEKIKNKKEEEMDEKEIYEVRQETREFMEEMWKIIREMKSAGKQEKV
jgi:predicted nucleotidyltransferase/uncharacterized protein (UPF0332 family)